MKSKKIFLKAMAGIILIIILVKVWIGYQVNAATQFTLDDCPYDVEFVKLTNEFYASVGIDTNGNIWGWGDSGIIADVTNSIIPVQITSGTRFSDVKLGHLAKYALALDTSGNIWAFGENGSGQFGNGTTTDSTTLIRITSGTKFTKIATGFENSMAIDENENLWSWGSGPLGDGTTGDSSTPVQIMEGTTFSQIAAAGLHSMAIDTSGNLWTWGDNSNGQLGNGTTTDAYTPIQIMEGTTFSQIATGDNHSIAIDTSGNLWTWGDNYNGQLGDGTTTDSYVPIQITSGINFEKIAIGTGGRSYNEADFAIDSEGNLWSWGCNEDYWLGNGSTENVLEPQKILEGKKFKEISVGAHYAMAIDTNGDAWSWGFNAYGAKGTGYYAPAKPIRFTGDDYLVTFKNGEEIVKQESVKFNKNVVAPLITKDGYTLSWDNKTYRNNGRFNNKCNMDKKCKL